VRLLGSPGPRQSTIYLEATWIFENMDSLKKAFEAKFKSFKMSTGNDTEYHKGLFSRIGMYP
jgi:hypothetical protein